MAKQVPTFTALTGVTVANSYWRCSNITVDVESKIARFTFRGFIDAATSTRAKTDKTVQPISTKVVIVRNDPTTNNMAFDLGYSAEIAKQKNLAQIAYESAVAQGLFVGATDV